MTEIKTNLMSVVDHIVRKSKFYVTDAKQYFMLYKPDVTKGVFPLEPSNIYPIITSYMRKPCGSGQKQFIYEMVMIEAKKTAVEQQVFTRCAYHDDALYLDLGKNGIVEITAEHIEILQVSPVPFYRHDTMRDLPIPKFSKKLSPKQAVLRLRKILNIPVEDLRLVVAWLLSAFCPGTKPILILEGSHGSAKSSTMCNIIRILDWHSSMLTGLPKTDRDLLVAVRNRGIAGFDNISKITDNISDLLCQIATGGSGRFRKLYSDGDEYVIHVHTLIALNGITTGATRGDLLDRALRVETPPLRAKTRKTEEEVEAAIAKYHPIILGALLQAVQYALQNPCKLPVELRESRLVDFCEWSYRWAPALGLNPSNLVKYIIENQKGTKLEVLSNDSVAAIILDLVDRNGGEWVGTSSALLEEFSYEANVRKIQYSERMKSPVALTSWLKREAPALEAAGIKIEKLARSGNRRPILITRI